jgi:hypothetical protein
MKVEAEMKEMYKVILGDNGMCMGQYYPEDDWKKSYYGETIEEILDVVNVRYYKGLPKTFDLEKWNVLIYDGHIYDYDMISYYNRYTKEKELEWEHNTFYFQLNNNEKYKEQRKRMIDADKEREDKDKEAIRIKAEQEKQEKELSEYEYLKNKYGK